MLVTGDDERDAVTHDMSRGRHVDQGGNNTGKQGENDVMGTFMMFLK